MGMLSFISRQSTKKMSVFKLFPTRRKQKNTSLNNLTAQVCVKFFFFQSCIYCQSALDGQLVSCICSVK